MKGDSTTVETGGKNLCSELTVDAPRELVWEAWTNPERIGRWWRADGSTTMTDEMDVRPGGHGTYTMTDRGGDEHRHLVAYGEIDHPEHLEYTLEPDDSDADDRSAATVDLTAHDDATTVTMEIRFRSAGALDEAIACGVAEGTAETLPRLAGHLAEEEVTWRRTRRGRRGDR